MLPVLAMVAVLLGGCGGGATGEISAVSSVSTAPQPRLDVGSDTWELTEATIDGQPLAVPTGHRITLRVDGEQVGGTAACNGYGSTWTVDGAHVRVGADIGQSAMGCAPDVQAAESRYLGALPRVETGVRDGGQLRLSGDGVDLTFVAQEPAPVADLVGATWVLESTLVRGVESAVAGEPATLLLADDGTLSGSTGCRTLTGEYDVSGDEVHFWSLGADGECPDELWAQDSHVVEVLGDGFQADVDVDGRLVLSSVGQIGLMYGAD